MDDRGTDLEGAGEAREWSPRRLAGWTVALAAVASCPLFLPSHLVGLATQVLIMAIFAMSLDLLVGYTGLVSFGHAAFFGTGAYVTAFLSQGGTSNLFVSVPVVVVATAALAFVVGYLIVHTSGIYFLMITLAFAQMLYGIVIGWSEVTGGANGLAGLTRPVLGVGPWSFQFDGYASFFYLILGVFLVSWALMHSVVNSPFGWVLRAIRENEERTRALGYDTHLYKSAAFTLGAVFAAVAGQMLAHYNWFADPQELYWTTSGEGLVMLIVGGYGTLTGPVLGAALLELLPYWLSDFTEHTLVLVGAIFCLFVLFAPEGIVGLLSGDDGGGGGR